jgi:hypothetical protein
MCTETCYKPDFDPLEKRSQFSFFEFYLDPAGPNSFLFGSSSLAYMVFGHRHEKRTSSTVMFVTFCHYGIEIRTDVSKNESAALLQLLYSPSTATFFSLSIHADLSISIISRGTYHWFRITSKTMFHALIHADSSISIIIFMW